MRDSPSDNGLHAAEWWVKRTLDYGRNATRLGADGLIGIHWRTLAHAPEFSSLAIFPWLNASRAASISSSDIYTDIAMHEFGLSPSDAATAAALMGTCDHTWNTSGPIMGDYSMQQVRNGLFEPFKYKTIFLPRQARDKHRENSTKARFVEVVREWLPPDGVAEASRWQDSF